MKRRAAGFTILELVLSMTALALLAAICYAAFYLGIRAVERGEVAVVAGQRLRAATDVIVRQVRSAWADAGCDGDEPVVHFDGRPTSLAFATSAGLGSGGRPAWVRYEVVGDASDLCTVPPCLIMTEFPMREGGEPTPPVSLLEGFEALSFRYDPGNEDCEDDEGGFTDETWCRFWSGPDMTVLPRAVRLEIAGLPAMPRWEQDIPVLLARMSDPDGDGVGLVFEDEDRYGCGASFDEDDAGLGGTGGGPAGGEDDDDEVDIDVEDDE